MPTLASIALAFAAMLMGGGCEPSADSYCPAVMIGRNLACNVYMVSVDGRTGTLSVTFHHSDREQR